MTSIVAGVQYLWKVYTSFESKGEPNTLKLEFHCAPPRKIRWFLSFRTALTIRLYSGSSKGFNTVASKKCAMGSLSRS